MIVTIDPAAPVAPFQQLRDQITAMITSRALPPGHRLPPVRRLAEDLDLAPNTVARAYRELEHAGFVHTAGRRGTVVADIAADRDSPARLAERTAEQVTDSYLETMLSLGHSTDAIVTLVQRRLAPG